MYIIGLRPQKRISFCLCIYIHIYARKNEAVKLAREKVGRQKQKPYHRELGANSWKVGETNKLKYHLPKSK